jgi:hypothetical protein
MCESGSVFYAHNLTFDGIILINFLPEDVILENKNTSIKRGSLYSLCLKNNTKHIIFKCSAKLLPLKLSEIADKLDLPKKLDMDHSNVDERSINDKIFQKKVLEYCKRDVDITHKFLKQIDFCLNTLLPY